MTSPSFEQIEPPAASLSKLRLPLYHKTAMIASGQASPRSSDPSGAGRGNPPSLGLYCTTTETQGWLPNAAGPGGARDKDGTRSPANYCCVALGRSTPSTFFLGRPNTPSARNHHRAHPRPDPERHGTARAARSPGRLLAPGPGEESSPRQTNGTGGGAWRDGLGSSQLSSSGAETTRDGGERDRIELSLSLPPDLRMRAPPDRSF